MGPFSCLCQCLLQDTSLQWLLRPGAPWLSKVTPGQAHWGLLCPAGFASLEARRMIWHFVHKPFISGHFSKTYSSNLPRALGDRRGDTGPGCCSWDFHVACFEHRAFLCTVPGPKPKVCFFPSWDCVSNKDSHPATVSGFWSQPR